MSKLTALSFVSMLPYLAIPAYLEYLMRASSDFRWTTRVLYGLGVVLGVSSFYYSGAPAVGITALSTLMLMVLATDVEKRAAPRPEPSRLERGLSDAVCVYDGHGRLLDANPGACKLMGPKPPTFQSVYGDKAFHMLMRDGTRRDTLQWNGKWLDATFDLDRRADRIFVVARDATDRRKSEMEAKARIADLSDQIAFLNAMTDYMPDGLMYLQAERAADGSPHGFTVLYMNTVLRRWLGMDAAPDALDDSVLMPLESWLALVADTQLLADTAETLVEYDWSVYRVKVSHPNLFKYCVQVSRQPL